MTTTSADSSSDASGAHSALKSGHATKHWLASYRPEWIRHDVIAGVTLAAYAIPVAMAYSTLAELPPENGIYCYLVAGIFYALFGTSRQLAIGPTSAISMLVGSTIGAMAVSEPDHWAAIASLAALLVAILCVIAYVLRLSTLVNFISETILLGFKAGAALTIAMTQLPKLFGVPGGGDHFFERIVVLASQLSSTNFVVLSLGLVILALLLAGERLFPGRPVALAVVAVAITAVSLFSLDQRGVSTVGVLPQGLPRFTIPSLRLRDVDGIVSMAAACFLLAYIEGISAARTLALKNGYEISPRTELLGLGAANLAVAFAQGFPVAGGLSQSAVNDKAGAKTPLALVFASITLALCLLFLTGLLANLPNVALAAIVLVAVRGLINIHELRHLYRVSRYEFGISMVAFGGVLVFGILRGVLLAVLVSLLMLLRGAAHPRVATLGRIPGSRRYSDVERHPDNEPVPGVMIVRVEGSLLYFNVDHVRSAIVEKIGSVEALQQVICDLSNSPTVDVAGARMLVVLHQDLAAQGVTLRVVEAHARSRDLLRAEGVEERTGYLGRHLDLDSAIAEFEKSHTTPTNASTGER